MAFSYKLDAPTAPVIVAGLASVFFVLLMIRHFTHRNGPA
jgi:ABC-type Mn2+/Zn2+ transport system permease subunit